MSKRIIPFTPYKIDGFFGEFRDTYYHAGRDVNGLGGGNTDCGTKLYPIHLGGKTQCVYYGTSSKGYGNLLVYKTMTPTGWIYIRYAHLKKSFIDPGEEIDVSKPVALMGTSGNSKYCHLHYDILKEKPKNWRVYAKTKQELDQFIDPLTFGKIDEIQKASNMIEIAKKKFEELVTKASTFDAFAAEGFSKLEDIRERIEKLKKEKRRAEKDLVDLRRQTEKKLALVETEESQRLKNRIEELEDELKAAEESHNRSIGQHIKHKEELQSFKHSVIDALNMSKDTNAEKVVAAIENNTNKTQTQGGGGAKQKAAKETIKEPLRWLFSLIAAAAATQIVTYAYNMYPVLGTIQPNMQETITIVNTVLFRGFIEYRYALEKYLGKDKPGFRAMRFEFLD